MTKEGKMLHERIERMNRQLADAFGRNLHGEGRYKWAIANTVMFPFKTSNDSLKFTEVPQVEKKAWSIAAWEDPPTPAAWRSMFGSEVPYPSNGMYFVSDVILGEGIDPTEEMTQAVIGALKYKGAKVRTMREAYDRIEAKMEAHERAVNSRQESFLADCCEFYPHISLYLPKKKESPEVSK
jgi:hypothetical protein